MNAKTVTINTGGMAPYSNHLSWDCFPMITITNADADYTLGFDSGHTESFLDHTWSEKLLNLKDSETIMQGIGSARAEQVKIAEEFCFCVGASNTRK